MASSKASDSSRSRWSWGKRTKEQEPPSPGCLPRPSSSEKRHRFRSSHDKVSDDTQKDDPATTHHGRSSTDGRSNSHKSGGSHSGGGGGTGKDDGASGQPRTAIRENPTFEQILSPVPQPTPAKTEKRSPKKIPVTPGPERLPTVPDGGAVDPLPAGTDAELPAADRKTLQGYLRGGLESQRVTFDKYSHDLRDAYGTARTKEQITDTIARVSNNYKIETDNNIKQQNLYVAHMIKRLAPHLKAPAMEYWDVLFEAFKKFMSTSMIAAQQADVRSVKLMERFWTADKKMEDAVGNAYDQAMSVA